MMEDRFTELIRKLDGIIRLLAGNLVVHRKIGEAVMILSEFDFKDEHIARILNKSVNLVRVMKHYEKKKGVKK